MTCKPENKLVEEQNQTVVAEAGRVLAEDRESLVEREECLTVAPSLGVVGAEELADEHTDQLRAFFRTWRRDDSRFETLGIPLPVDVAELALRCRTFPERAEERTISHLLAEVFGVAEQAFRKIDSGMGALG